MNINEIIAKSDYIITFGSFLAADNIEIQDSIIEAIAKNSAEFVYMHPIDNVDLKLYYSQFIKYEVGSEEGVSSLLLSTFGKEVPENIQRYIEDLDLGYISAESSAGEEEFEEAFEKSIDKKQKTLIIGRDIYSHERLANIIRMLVVLNKYSSLNVISLDKRIQDLLDTASLENIEEVEELHSYNGTVLYRTYGEEDIDVLVGSESFARIAKVANNDNVYINCSGQKFRRKFVVNKDLFGTIALCAMHNDDNSLLSKGYRYKQVKIEKADE